MFDFNFSIDENTFFNGLIEHIDYATIVQALANTVSPDDVACFVDLSGIADNIAVDDLATCFDLGRITDAVLDAVDVEDIASHIDVSDVADSIDYRKLAYEVSVCDIAQYVDASDVAMEMSPQLIADNLDYNLIADHISYDVLSNNVARELQENNSKDGFQDNAVDFLEDYTNGLRCKFGNAFTEAVKAAMVDVFVSESNSPGYITDYIRNTVPESPSVKPVDETLFVLNEFEVVDILKSIVLELSEMNHVHDNLLRVRMEATSFDMFFNKYREIDLARNNKES